MLLNLFFKSSKTEIYCILDLPLPSWLLLVNLFENVSAPREACTVADFSWGYLFRFSWAQKRQHSFFFPGKFIFLFWGNSRCLFFSFWRHIISPIPPHRWSDGVLSSECDWVAWTYPHIQTLSGSARAI